jgi:hypothetical protein
MRARLAPEPECARARSVSLSSGDLAGLKDMDGFGQLPGAPEQQRPHSGSADHGSANKRVSLTSAQAPGHAARWEQNRPASAAPIICSCAALNNIAAGSNRRQNGGTARVLLNLPPLTVMTQSAPRPVMTCAVSCCVCIGPGHPPPPVGAAPAPVAPAGDIALPGELPRGAYLPGTLRSPTADRRKQRFTATAPARSRAPATGSAGWRMSHAARGGTVETVSPREGDGRRGRRRLIVTEEL